MSALLPRLSGAQDIARDTARGVAISQIQTAIMSYRSLHGKWPSDTSTGTKNLTILVKDNLLTEVPWDPYVDLDLPEAFNSWWDIPISWDFLYILRKKNGKTNGAVVLAAKTETPGKSNYVSKDENKLDLQEDYRNIFPCKEVELKEDATTEEAAKIWFANTETWDNKCYAKNSEQLRYILKF